MYEEEILQAQALSGLSAEEIEAELIHAENRKNNREEHQQTYGTSERDADETVQFSARLTARIRFAETRKNVSSR